MRGTLAELSRRVTIVVAFALFAAFAAAATSVERIRRLWYPDFVLLRESVADGLGLAHPWDSNDPDAVMSWTVSAVDTSATDGEAYPYARRLLLDDRLEVFAMSDLDLLPDSARASFVLGLEDALDRAEGMLEGVVRFENLEFGMGEDGFFPRDALHDILLNSFELVAKDLGLAYTVTDDERYASAFRQYFEAWSAAAEPLPRWYVVGHVTHPQAYYLFTVVRRAQALRRSLQVFESSPIMTPEFAASLAASTLAHVRYIDAAMSDWLSHSGPKANRDFWETRSNAPLITAARQLWLLSSLPGLADRSGMLERTFDVLDRTLTSNLTAEGFQIERDVQYHDGSLFYVADAVLRARAAGVDTPPALQEKFRSSFAVLNAILLPDGTLPPLGTTVPGRRPGNYSRIGNALYGTELNVRAPLEDLRFQPPEGDIYDYLDRLKTLANAPAGTGPTNASVALEDTGFYVLRSGEGVEALYMLFDAAPSFGHSHDDALGIQISGFGSTTPRLLLPEAGGGFNWSRNPRAAEYAHPYSHNVLVVDGQALNAGDGRPSPTEVRAFLAEPIDRVVARLGEHYEGLDWTRDVVFIRGDYWLVRDVVEGPGRHELDQVFHFAPPQAAGGDGIGLVTSTTAGGSRVVSGPVTQPTLRVYPTSSAAAVVPIESWTWHPEFGPGLVGGPWPDVPLPSMALRTVHGGARTALWTLLQPASGVGDGFLEVSELRDGPGGGELTVTSTDLEGRERVDVFVADLQDQSAGHDARMTGSGDLAVARWLDSGGPPLFVCLLQGRRLTAPGIELSLNDLGDVCIHYAGGEWLVNSTRPGRFEVVGSPSINFGVGDAGNRGSLRVGAS